MGAGEIWKRGPYYQVAMRLRLSWLGLGMLAAASCGCSDEKPSDEPKGGSTGSAAGGTSSGGKSPGGIVSVAGFATVGGSGGNCSGGSPAVGCPPAKETPPEAAIALGDGGWGDLALDESHVYLTISDSIEKTPSKVVAFSKQGGEPETLFENDEFYRFGQLKYADGFLYWVAGTLAVGSDQYSAIRRYDLAAKQQEEIYRVTATTMAPFYDGTIAQIAIAGSRLIEAQPHDGDLWAMDLDGSNKAVLAQPGCDWATVVAVDGDYAYYGTSLFGQVGRAPLSGEGATLLTAVNACSNCGASRSSSGIAAIGDTLYVGENGALNAYDLTELSEEELGTKSLTPEPMWMHSAYVGYFQVVAGRLFFLTIEENDLAAIRVIEPGDSEPTTVIDKLKIRHFIMEPDGKSGFLWGFADYKPYLMPFDVP
jgi:hypothetical protein